MSTNAHVLELLPGYALECLEEDELILVSEHLAVCSTCRAELDTYQAVIDRLAWAVPESDPSLELKRQLMDRIRSPQTGQLSWRQLLTNFMRRPAPVWGVAGLLLILVLLASNLLLWQRVNQLESTAQKEAMQTITLAGTQTAPDASGLIILSLDGRHGTLVVDRLPTLDSAHEYQLWLIEDGQRESGAVFSVNQDGYGSVWVSSPEPLASYSAFGISIEPTGGSPGPTGDKVLGGTFQVSN